MVTLGVETSCDETAVALTQGLRVLSNAVSSSVHLHKKFGGVVPEIASRYHVEYIQHVLFQAIQSSGKSLNDVRLVAVTRGPGLIGSLLVGTQMAKAIAYALTIPIIGVNHVLAHLYSAFMGAERSGLRYPYIGLVVSGGHTSIYLCRAVNNYKLLGQTQDDALGEAYDKVAKILKLGYPGGPLVEKRARSSKRQERLFPKTYLGKGSLDFSFSGIKTAVLYYAGRPKRPHAKKKQAIDRKPRLSQREINDIAFAFQESVLDVTVDKTMLACERYNINRVVIGGGVSANMTLREKFAQKAAARNIRAFFPSADFCTDNAAMIAGLGEALYKKGARSSLSLTPDANLKYIGCYRRRRNSDY